MPYEVCTIYSMLAHETRSKPERIRTQSKPERFLPEQTKIRAVARPSKHRACQSVVARLKSSERRTGGAHPATNRRCAVRHRASRAHEAEPEPEQTQSKPETQTKITACCESKHVARASTHRASQSDVARLWSSERRTGGAQPATNRRCAVRHRAAEHTNTEQGREQQ